MLGFLIDLLVGTGAGPLPGRLQRRRTPGVGLGPWLPAKLG